MINNIDHGGANRDRTGDLLHAMQALSQLSYSPAAAVLPYHNRAAILGSQHGFVNQKSGFFEFNFSLHAHYKQALTLHPNDSALVRVPTKIM